MLINKNEKKNFNLVLYLSYIVLEIIFIKSLSFNVRPLSKNEIYLILFYQFLIFLTFIFIKKKKFIKTNLTIFLVLFLNLVWYPINDLHKLTPNLKKKIKVVGKVMPGFYGINTITTDELGFRSPLPINYKYKYSYRIFAIGGSTTEEIFTDDKETWTAKLQFKLQNKFSNQLNVINTGVSGLRSVNHIATQNYISNLYPNLLIFLVGVNDWNKHIKSIVQNKKVFEDNSFFPHFHRSLIYKSVNILKEIYFSSETSSDYNLIKGEYYLKQNNSLLRSKKISLNINTVSKNYKKNILEIIKNCKISKYSCMFITQPNAYSHKTKENLIEKFWMTPPNAKYTLDLDSLIKISNIYNTWLVDLGKKFDVPVCDISKKISPTIKNFYDDVHFNEEGSKNVSRLVFNCITRYFSKDIKYVLKM